jgi:hypothetical protein
MLYGEQEDCTMYSLHVKDLLQKIRCRQTIHHYLETRFAPNISAFSISATLRINDTGRVLATPRNVDSRE